MEQSLGAYYQCYKNEKSFKNTIQSFRIYYPAESVYVVSDGGNDYREFCSGYKCKFIMDTKLHTGKNLVFFSLNSIFLFVKRLWDGLENIMETHCILLEDDVRIQRRHTVPFLYSINGCNMNEFLPIQMQQILINRGYKGPFYFGACGGCVLDVSFFKGILFTDIETLLEELPRGMYASDQIISFIALAFGGTIGQYEEFAEMWYPDIHLRLKENKVSFLHQYKLDYD